MGSFKISMTNLAKEYLDFTYCIVLVKYTEPTSCKYTPREKNATACISNL